MTTGEKIASSRKNLKMTQEELAARLSVTRQAVSRWESDAAFPETDKLLKMSKIFGCSVDWLLKYDGQESEENTEDEGNILMRIACWHFEYKSKKMLGNLPLVHINIGRGRTAKGFFAMGIKSVGVFSLGLLSVGIISFGVLALGLLAVASAGVGFISLGAIALGIFSAGGVSVGVVAVGGVAVGLFALGGCTAGGFSFGGVAYGSYIAIGDRAYGGIALGGTVAQGSVFSAKQIDFADNAQEIYGLFDNLPSGLSLFVNWCRRLFDAVLNGTIKLGN